jgi:hypothetical protein
VQPRSIAILGGTGRQGRGLAQRLASAGYRIVVGSRNPTQAAESVRAWRVSDRVSVATYVDAVARADRVILALPFDAIAATLERLRGTFTRGLVIDVSVPVVFEAGQAALARVPEGSAAEHVRARLPPEVAVAAAFKTIPAHVLDEVDRPLDCDEFVCGDSGDARAAAVELVEAIAGLRAIDVGPLSRARSIEHLTLLAIGINRRHKSQDARFRIVGL